MQNGTFFCISSLRNVTSSLERWLDWERPEENNSNGMGHFDVHFLGTV